MKDIFSESSNTYNLRNPNEFKSSNIRTVHYGTETISFRGPKTWSLVPDEIKNSKSVLEFKKRIRSWKPEGCTCRLCQIFVPDLGFL